MDALKADQRSLSDEDVMRLVRGGDRCSLTLLVHRYAGSLLTFVERMLGNRHLAEEVFQEVFLQVWLKRHQYRYPLAFRSWLFGIAANRCRQELRRKRIPLEPADATWLPDRGGVQGEPPDAVALGEQRALVQQAVDGLPAQQRAVVVLRIWNGLSFADIGQSLGCSEPTARSHMHHGLASMRRFLEPRLS